MNTLTKSEKKKESLWNMSDESEIEGFIDKLQACTSNDQLIIAGMVLMLEEISKQDSLVSVTDYCDSIVRCLYSWTVEEGQSRSDYISKLKTRKISEFR